MLVLMVFENIWFYVGFLRNWLIESLFWVMMMLNFSGLGVWISLMVVVVFCLLWNVISWDRLMLVSMLFEMIRNCLFSWLVVLRMLLVVLSGVVSLV